MQLSGEAEKDRPLDEGVAAAGTSRRRRQQPSGGEDDEGTASAEMDRCCFARRMTAAVTGPQAQKQNEGGNYGWRGRGC